MRIWSSKGVALYPPDFGIVGQNRVFNALHQFRRNFWDGISNDIAGFFVLVGDWGLGKTRIGYELIAETADRVDRWILNRDEFVLSPFDRQPARILEPQLSGGILPLYLRYWMVCEEEGLRASNWVARVSCAALLHLIDCPASGGIPGELYDDLRMALKAKGVDYEALRPILTDASPDYDNRLKQAMEQLRPQGIHHLWIVVDEVERPGDLKIGLREEEHRIDEAYLMMASEVIKHEGWRSAHPYVNFLLLCSSGMQDVIGIGPNLRRCNLVTLEPNQVSDVRRYVDHLKREGPVPEGDLDYPPGTLEAAFLAANRNFGWFNVIMASIHENYKRHKAQGQNPAAWKLIEEFANSDPRAEYIFSPTIVPLLGTPPGVNKEDIGRLTYGQLPVAIGGGTEQLPLKTAESLLRVEVPGQNQPAFAELVQVHIDERTLAAELVKPEIGFKHRTEDTYYYTNCELSVGGLLAALRAFSVGIAGDVREQDFVIYKDLDQWAEQLASLYPREGIAFAAEALHRIFTRPEFLAREAGTQTFCRFIGMSANLVKQFDKLLSQETQVISFFRDSRDEPKIEEYLKEQSSSGKKRRRAICEGLARILDDNLEATSSSSILSEVEHVTFTSEFVSPTLEGLRVTRDGRVSVAYCEDPDRMADVLKNLLGLEAVHPIVVLFGPQGNVSAFKDKISAFSPVQRCVLTRRLNTFEEEFLIKYSGRGSAFDPDQNRLSPKSHQTLSLLRADWREMSLKWRQEIDSEGYLLSPVWSRRQQGKEDFYRGYRYMLVHGGNIDHLPAGSGPGQFSDAALDNIRTGCKRNFEVPRGTWQWGPLLPILASDEPYRPDVPPCFFTLLREMKSLTSLSNLTRRFFFSVPEKPSKLKVEQQLLQVVELLMGLDVVVQEGDNYRSINASILKKRRESASTWIDGACADSIEEIRDFFKAQAEELQKGQVVFAKGYLEQAEAKIDRIDFEVLERSSPSPDDFIAFVKAIDEANTEILKVCPLDVQESYGGFDCSPAQIARYEARFNELSLWEKVNFLKWLRDNFIRQREAIIGEIAEILVEAVDLQTIEGRPFPISPLTQPLRSIKQELTAGVSTSRVTLKAKVEVQDFPHEISRYFLASKYSDAWRRLEGLGDLVSKGSSNSFWKRFKDLHDEWVAGIEAFNSAEEKWKRLQSFMEDAPATAWDGFESTKRDFEKLHALADEALKHNIDRQVGSVDVDKLIDDLATEVKATVPKMKEMSSKIERFYEDKLADLRNIIAVAELQALNHVLRARRERLEEEPKPCATYGATKAAYERFNTEVAERGRKIFEELGGKATWGVWVEIAKEINEGTYDSTRHPEHGEILTELSSPQLPLLRSRWEFAT